MMEHTKSYDRLLKLGSEIVQLEQIAALLQWDEETQMPERAIAGRSDQIALIEGMIHDRRISSQMGELLEQLKDQPGDDHQKALVRIHSREYDRQVKIPRSLITQLSIACSRGQAAWAKAREHDDFTEFQPYLGRIIELKKEWAQAAGFDKHPYDPLVDEYEPGMTCAGVESVFSQLETPLSDLVEEITRLEKPDDAFLYRQYDRQLQDRFGRMIVQDMGIESDRFFMTESVHPFTTTLGADDVRITTRYSEPAVTSTLFSTIHEAGHALYELGASNEKTRGTALAAGSSLGIHESQSRLWENMIGRSREFWEHYLPKFRALFPAQLEDVSDNDFIRAVNKAEPSHIRVNADELTYTLHIILRFKLEKALIEGALSVSDLRDAWNQLSEELLHLRVEHDRDGVLQDVHWSAGLFGYFPTYAMGNLYAAQFLDTLKTEHPDYGDWLRTGSLNKVQQWLYDRIHRHGSVYTASQLITAVSGRELDASCFMQYLQQKYRTLYS
jgi:carboxypeptidase Taq